MSTTRTYQVTGMTCDHCVAAVTREVEALEPVSEVRVDLGSGEVTVVSERPLTDDEITGAVDEAGYQIA